MKRVTKETKMAAARLYRSGLTLVQVARKFGRSTAAVSFWLKDVGQKTRGNNYFVAPKRKLTKADAMWMASALDCEGTITFHSGKSQFQTVVRIEMCSAAFVRRVGGLCGGWSGIDLPQRGNRKPHSIWQVNANGARWLLPQILRFLIVKRRQAELVLEVLSINRMGKRRTEKTVRRCYRIRDEMWELNKRGKRGRDTWANDPRGRS